MIVKKNINKKSENSIKKFQLHVRKKLLKKRLYHFGKLTHHSERILYMMNTYNMIYNNPKQYRAEMLLTTFKEHLRDQLWSHYQMLVKIMWELEVSTKNRPAIPEVLTDLILDFCGPPDKYVQNFQTKWYRMLCYRINHKLYYGTSSTNYNYWNIENIQNWVRQCWLRLGWGEGYQRRDIWKANYRKGF